MENANDILFRCSSLGHLMPGPREKKGDIQQTTVTHLVDVFVSAKYNRFTEIKGKQLSKGNDTEEDSITVVSLVTKTFLKKNEQHLCNEYIKGTPDLFIGNSIQEAEVVRDTKSAWSIYTFNRAKAKEVSDMYYWQGMGYMALTGAKKCFIDYCLNNTPYYLVNKELYQEGFAHDQNTPAWIELQIIANHVYDKKTFDEYIQRRGIDIDTDEYSRAVYAGFVEVPLAERHFCFEFDRDEKAIQAIYDRVKECREYMNTNLFKCVLKEEMSKIN